MADNNNLLVRLHGWVNRQDENFTTEAFVYVLRHLLDHEPQVAVRLLKRLTKGAMDVPSEKAKSISIRTQVTTTEGRPDVEIRTNDHLVFMEVKVQSKLGWGQLKHYRSDLQASGVAKTSLVLLTRYFTERTAGGEIPDSLVRWYQIADWLVELDSKALANPASRYVVGQFLDFLSARGMTMEQVGWEMVQGVRAMHNFLALLREAAKACGLPAKPSKVPDHAGFRLNNRLYWIGFSYAKPGILSLHTNQVRIDLDKAKNLGKGKLWERTTSPGGWAWSLELGLESEEVHFFARTRASQMQCLEKFIREFLDAVSQIKSTGQAELSANEAAGDDEDEVTDLENEQCPQ